MKTTKARKGRDMSAADIIKEAWRIVASMEDGLRDASVLADGVAILAVDSVSGVDEKLGAVLMRLGNLIEDYCEALEERRGELFQLLHPNRAMGEAQHERHHHRVSRADPVAQSQAGRAVRQGRGLP